MTGTSRPRPRLRLTWRTLALAAVDTLIVLWIGSVLVLVARDVWGWFTS